MTGISPAAGRGRMSSKFCQLWLTCADKKEADKIAVALLAKHLVVCVKQLPVTADYRWQGKIEHADEVLLLMDSRMDLFEHIEQEVKRLHSYDTFVLEATPVEKVSRPAQEWLKQEL
jgi:periplasmic divalent cation tolerance protein